MRCDVSSTEYLKCARPQYELLNTQYLKRPEVQHAHPQADSRACAEARAEQQEEKRLAELKKQIEEERQQREGGRAANKEIGGANSGGSGTFKPNANASSSGSSSSRSSTAS